MQMILLVLIAIVFLAGIAAFAIGRQGWNLGTIAAGVLVLLASLAFTFLAGMVAQRERAWRSIVETYQKAIAQERDGLVPSSKGTLEPAPDKKPLTALAQEKARWQRVKRRIDDWGGRAWPTAAFAPPTADKPGTITVEDLEKLTLNPGAELYVFDKADVAEEGRFLGAFRVEAVNGNIVSVTAAAPPTPDDESLWAKPREAVTVYESLPNDTWLAFHRTSATPEEDAEADGTAARPTARKIDPEDLLKHLEKRLEEVRQHAEPMAEEKWPELFEQLEKGELLPGRYWARVEFKEPYSLPRVPGDTREPVQFESGDTVSFDLETARKLTEQTLEDDKDKKVAEIVSVEERRPLADPLTALRGGEHALPSPEGNGPGAKIQIEGSGFVRRMLDADIAAIGAMTDRLKAAKTSADNQLGIHAKEAEDLNGDLANWQADAEAAGQTAERFEKRVTDLVAELGGVESAIVELGRELAGASALLTKEIDLAAPAPLKRAAAPAGGQLP